MSEITLDQIAGLLEKTFEEKVRRYIRSLFKKG